MNTQSESSSFDFTERSSVTSKDGLGFSMPLRGSEKPSNDQHNQPTASTADEELTCQSIVQDLGTRSRTVQIEADNTDQKINKLIARVEELEAKSTRDSETIAKMEKALTEADANLKSMKQLLEAKHTQDVGPPPIIGKQWVRNERLAFAKICRFILMNLRFYRRWHQYPRKFSRRFGGGTPRRQ